MPQFLTYQFNKGLSLDEKIMVPSTYKDMVKISLVLHWMYVSEALKDSYSLM